MFFHTVFLPFFVGFCWPSALLTDVQLVHICVYFREEGLGVVVWNWWCFLVCSVLSMREDSSRIFLKDSLVLHIHDFFTVNNTMIIKFRICSPLHSALMVVEPDIGLQEKVKNKIENFNFCKTTHLGLFHSLLILTTLLSFMLTVYTIVIDSGGWYAIFCKSSCHTRQTWCILRCLEAQLSCDLCLYLSGAEGENYPKRQALMNCLASAIWKVAVSAKQNPSITTFPFTRLWSWPCTVCCPGICTGAPWCSGYTSFLRM